MADLTNADVINAYANVPQHVIEGFGDEGDLTRQYLLNPALFELLGDVRDTPILDAGCGQGYLARLLARRGARVTGLEPSYGFCRYPVQREQTEQIGIQYVQVDLSTWGPPTSTFQTVIAASGA
jgi:2-polyprenyl-3-methyl-5-hydroxy-6-metoxy-1,4-benzoquinol methylase